MEMCIRDSYKLLHYISRASNLKDIQATPINLHPAPGGWYHLQGAVEVSVGYLTTLKLSHHQGPVHAVLLDVCKLSVYSGMKTWSKNWLTHKYQRALCILYGSI